MTQLTQLPANQLFCPEVMDYIHFKKLNDAGEVAILDRRSDKVMGTIGQDELSIIALCTGKNSFGSMAAQLQEHQSTLLGFLQQLEAQKIVRFNYM